MSLVRAERRASVRASITWADAKNGNRGDFRSMTYIRPLFIRQDRLECIDSVKRVGVRGDGCGRRCRIAQLFQSLQTARMRGYSIRVATTSAQASTNLSSSSVNVLVK